MIILSRSQYRLNEIGGIFIVIPALTLQCPICGANQVVLGRRIRSAILPDANNQRYKIRRLRCSGCRKIHHELPDCLVPYKRHCTEIIENVIKDKLEDVPCEPNVIQKIKSWWSAMSGYYTNILISVAARIGVEPPKEPTFKEVIQSVVNSHSWTFPGKLPASGSGFPTSQPSNIL